MSVASTIDQFLDRIASWWGDHEAVIFKHTRMTYNDVLVRSMQISNALHRLVLQL